MSPIRAVALAVLLAGCSAAPPGPATPSAPVDEAPATNLHPTGWRGSEPSLGIREDGSMFVIAYDDVLRSQDGGVTWESVFSSRLDADEGEPVCVTCTMDPMLVVDPVTDRVYVDHLSHVAQCTRLFWSDDGTSWSANEAACLAPGGNDFQKLAAGAPGPDANPLAGATYASVLYLCFNKIYPTIPAAFFVLVGVATHCAVSYDGGRSFPIEQSVSGAPRSLQDGVDLGECGGGAGRPQVSAKGIVVVPLANSCTGGGLALSSDSGRTWTQRDVPEQMLAGSYPSVAFAREGDALYFATIVGYQQLLVARSTDLGASWEGPWNATPPGVTTMVMPALQAGDDGRIALAFHATRDAATSNPNTADDGARWHLLAATSVDAKGSTPTFRYQQLTPDDDPVQVGPICTGGAGCQGARNLLDFIGSALAPDGSFHVVFGDGCVDECAGDPAATPDDSRADQAVVAEVDGWSAYSDTS